MRDMRKAALRGLKAEGQKSARSARLFPCSFNRATPLALPLLLLPALSPQLSAIARAGKTR